MVSNKTIEALLRGQGCANSLKKLFENCEISSASTEPLINTILDSFSLALFSMDFPNLTSHHESLSRNMASLVPRRSSKKKIIGAEGLENYRDDSPTPLSNDGFAWRKYGQKTIKDTTHQRCYYRCSYEKDLNCNARKRVQKIKDNPPVYRTTYVGKHVCKIQNFAVNDDTYGSEMIKFDHAMSEPVMPPQFTSVDHQAITVENNATDHIMNQECNINDYLVDDDQFWANQFPPFPSVDLMFLDNLPGFD